MSTPFQKYVEAMRILDNARQHVKDGIAQIQAECDPHIYEVVFGDPMDPEHWSIYKPHDDAQEHMRCIWCGSKGRGSESIPFMRAKVKEESKAMRGMTDPELYGVSEEEIRKCRRKNNLYE